MIFLVIIIVVLINAGLARGRTRGET